MLTASSEAHMETINLLNAHAGVIASNQKIGTKKFYAKFEQFVQLFEGSRFNDNYLHWNPTSVTEAYSSFLHCCKDEVSQV